MSELFHQRAAMVRVSIHREMMELFVWPQDDYALFTL